MKVLFWWLIRFTAWFVALLFLMTSIAESINLSQIKFDCNCGSFENSEKFTGLIVLISSFILALCISFTTELWKAIKIMAFYFLIPVGVLYFIHFVNWVIGLTGIINLPLINTNSGGFIGFYSIFLIIYSVCYGVISLSSYDDDDCY